MIQKILRNGINNTWNARRVNKDCARAENTGTSFFKIAEAKKKEYHVFCAGHHMKMFLRRVMFDQIQLVRKTFSYDERRC